MDSLLRKVRDALIYLGFSRHSPNLLKSDPSVSRATHRARGLHPLRVNSKLNFQPSRNCEAHPSANASSISAALIDSSRMLFSTRRCSSKNSADVVMS